MNEKDRHEAYKAKAELPAQIVAAIDDYLEGKKSGREVCRWAIETLNKFRFDSSEVLLDTALAALEGVGLDDPRYDTPRQHLIQLRDALLGKHNLVVELGWYDLTQR